MVPLLQRGRNPPAGFFITALNRYRPFDDGYRTFVELIAGQIGARLATARAYETERDRAEQLAELDRAKTAFFTNVSHEFRTPLTLMLGPRRTRWPRPKSAAESTSGSGSRCSAQRAATAASGQHATGFLATGVRPARAPFEPVDLAALHRRAGEHVRSAAERVGLALTVVCPPAREPVCVDPDLWAKIVLNLLSNALKFTFDGGRHGRARADRERVELIVPRHRESASRPRSRTDVVRTVFRQVTARGGRTHEGSGIGLALVAELAAIHGGRVGLESTLGSRQRVRGRASPRPWAFARRPTRCRAAPIAAGGSIRRQGRSRPSY